jgi:hypothetical protein
MRLLYGKDLENSKRIFKPAKTTSYSTEDGPHNRRSPIRPLAHTTRAIFAIPVRGLDHGRSERAGGTGGRRKL